MTQPNKSDSQFADRSDNPQLAARGASVTAAAAATHSAPSVTVETLTENSNDSTPDTTIADCRTPISDSSGDSVKATDVNALTVLIDSNFADLADQQSKLRVDNAATLVELDDLSDDVNLMRTALNALIERMEAHGLIADN